MGPHVLLNASVPWMNEFNSLNQALGTDHHHWWLLLCFTSSVKLLGLGFGRKRMGKGYDGYSCNGTNLFLSREGKAKLFPQLKCWVRALHLAWLSEVSSSLCIKWVPARDYSVTVKCVQFRRQLSLHYRTQGSLKEAATTAVPLENLPCALVPEEPRGHTEHLQERNFSPLGVTLWNHPHF